MGAEIKWSRDLPSTHVLGSVYLSANQIVYFIQSTEASVEVDQWMKPQVDTAKKFLVNKAKFSDTVVVRLLMKMVYGHKTPVSSDPNVVK